MLIWAKQIKWQSSQLHWGVGKKFISKPGYIKPLFIQISNIVAVCDVCQEMHVGPLMGDFITLQ